MEMTRNLRDELHELSDLARRYELGLARAWLDRRLARTQDPQDPEVHADALVRTLASAATPRVGESLAVDIRCEADYPHNAPMRRLFLAWSAQVEELEASVKTARGPGGPSTFPGEQPPAIPGQLPLYGNPEQGADPSAAARAERADRAAKRILDTEADSC